MVKTSWCVIRMFWWMLNKSLPARYKANIVLGVEPCMDL